MIEAAWRSKSGWFCWHLASRPPRIEQDEPGWRTLYHADDERLEVDVAPPAWNGVPVLLFCLQMKGVENGDFVPMGWFGRGILNGEFVLMN